MQIDEKRVVEVIGRLRGRATSHKNAAEQTPNQGKAAAHLSAYDDLMSLANDLADATDDPEYAKSRKAYQWAVSRTPNAKVRGDAPLYGAASISTDGLCGDGKERT